VARVLHYSFVILCIHAIICLKNRGHTRPGGDLFCDDDQSELEGISQLRSSVRGFVSAMRRLDPSTHTTRHERERERDNAEKKRTVQRSHRRVSMLAILAFGGVVFTEMNLQPPRRKGRDNV